MLLFKVLLGSYWDNVLELKWSVDDFVVGNIIDCVEVVFYKYFFDIECFELEDENWCVYVCYKVDEICVGCLFSVLFLVYFEVDVEGNVEFEIDV